MLLSQVRLMSWKHLHSSNDIWKIMNLDDNSIICPLVKCNGAVCVVFHLYQYDIGVSKYDNARRSNLSAINT